MRRLLVVFALLCLALAPGCGGGSDDPISPATNPVEGATLSVGQVASLDRVDVLGLPAPTGAARAATEYTVAFDTEGAEELTLILDQDAESWFFLAPLHPVTPNQGGTLDVRIRLGSDESPPQTLMVEALPAAPGAFAAMVVKMHEHLDLVASLSGTSLAELKTTAATDVAEELRPLKLAQSYLDSDLDPHDLTDLAANGDGFLDAREADLLDRMFGYCDFEQYLQLQIDELQAQQGLAPLPWSRGEAGRRACIDVSPAITTAPELAQAMIRSRVAEIGADPDSQAGRILDAGGTMLTGAGFVPGFGRVAAVGGVALSAASASMGLIAGVNPSYFTRLEVTVDKTQFNEDSTEKATWDKVWVTAAATGWSADRFVTTSVISLLGGVLSDYEVAKIADSDVLRDVATVGLGAAAGAFFDDTGIIEFCPEEWRIDISSPLYCTAAALNHRFDVDIPAKTATPSDVGPDQLRVAAQAAQFGGREIHVDVPMEVKQIAVVGVPEEVPVELPGQDIPITAEISNADLTTLRWVPEKGAWNDGNLGTDTNDGGTRTLATPTSLNDYPFFVRIESLSRGGLRESGEPPRIGYVKVVLDAAQVVIDPQYVCISPGQSQQFTAEVTGIENYTVVWSVIEGYGSIDQNGLYQSLSGGTSNAVIEARLQENEVVFDTADLDAANCNCSMEAKITGDYTWDRDSSQAAYTIGDFGDLFYQFFFGFDVSGPPLISATFGLYGDQPSPRPGDTGSWKAGFTFATAAESWTSIWDDPKVLLPGVTITITELTETYMVGSLTGNAFQLNANGEIASIVGVDVKFRAGYWDGGAWPCN